MGRPANVDELLKKYGGDPGGYQVFVYVLLWFSMCGLSLNNLISLFIVQIYPHRCKVPEGFATNESIPRNPVTNEFESCFLYSNTSESEIIPCNNGWEYFPPDGEFTIVQQWDLVCDRSFEGALTTSVYFAGVTVGSAIFGLLADIIGRKFVIIGSLLTHVLLSVIIVLSDNYTMFVVLRFLDGFFLQGSFGSSYVLTVEMFQPRWRSLIAVISQTLWPAMLIVLSILFYFIKNWKTIFFICNMPFIISIPLIWLVPESIRWLLSVKKLGKAKKEVKRLARFNKKPIPATLGDEINNIAQIIAKESRRTDDVKRRYGLIDLVRRKKMRIVSCVSFYFHFVALFAFYAISFAIAGLKVNLYLSFICTSLIELAVSIPMFFVLKRLGRRQISIIMLSICGFISLMVVLLLLILPDENGNSQMAVAILAAFGRATLAGYFCVMPIYSSELSPTVLRNLLCGISNLWGRIGSMVAPQVMLLELYVWKPFPFLLCAILAFVGVGLTFLLPETKDRSLPNIPEDVDLLWRKGDVEDKESESNREGRRELTELTEVPLENTD